MIVTQLLNAISLLSPCLIWCKHKKKLGHLLVHKFVIWHLPISFMYHMLKAVHCKRLITVTMQKLDVVCIHSYAIICSWYGTTHKTKTIILSTLPNIYCIPRLLLSNKVETFMFTCVRLCSLAMSGKCLFQQSHKMYVAIKHGLMCSGFYLFDDNLYGYGHSIFHVILGDLYDCIFKEINEQSLENMLMCHSADNLVQSLE
jgi:hypothetical protein